jgi:hypothetical protein
VVADEGESDKEDKEYSEGSSVGDDNIISSPPRLVASIDSIQENADFVQLLE